MAENKANTALQVSETSRNGSESTQRIGHTTIATMASGQDTANNKHHAMIKNNVFKSSLRAHRPYPHPYLKGFLTRKPAG